jgi:hypothetical protein
VSLAAIAVMLYQDNFVTLAVIPVTAAKSQLQSEKVEPNLEI